MIKLDAYDKKISEILLSNSREQVSSIGKKIRLKRENVNYKLNRLVKEGLITGYNTIFNEKSLGLKRYVVFLELIKLKEESEKEVLHYLEEHKYMSWIGPSAGKWSIIFDVVLPEGIELRKVMAEFFNRFHSIIGEYIILPLEDGNYFGFKFLGLIKRNLPISENEVIKLDKKDKIILSLLNENSRVNFVEISEKIGLTPNGVANRIRNLEKSGVISGYTISLDWKILGYEWYGIQLKIMHFKEGLENELEKFLTHHKKVVFYNRYLGGAWDYDIGVIIENSNELRDFINKFRKSFGESVKISDVFLVLEETSGYKLPKGAFE